MNPEELPFMPHGGYRQLRSYRVAEVIYDATVVFCRRFYPNDRRMSDQMVQAARSGVRNISEGSGAAATSRSSEMKLTNVARASLTEELLPDYESFLRQNGLRVWPKDSKFCLAMRARLQRERDDSRPPTAVGPAQLSGLAGLAEFVGKADPEIAGNAMICAIHQAGYLLKRQIESQGRRFMADGGFHENLYRQRQKRRGSPQGGRRQD